MNSGAGKLGYWCGLSAFGFTVAFDVVQILQVAGTIRFPTDEILIYGFSLCIVVPFLLEMLALHHLTAHDSRFWTHASGDHRTPLHAHARAHGAAKARRAGLPCDNCCVMLGLRRG